MKRTITRIIARNFRALRNLDMVPDRVNMVIAPTGAGKTSLRAAAEYAARRRNGFTNEAGTGIATQVSHGTKAGFVAIHLGGDGAPEIELRAEFPKEAGTDMKRAAALSSFGLSETCLRSAFRGVAILEESDATRRDILCEALGIDVRIETLLRQLNEWTPAYPDLGDWLDEQTSKLQWSGLDYEKLCSEQRTGTNRLLREATQKVNLLCDRVLDENGQENPPPQVSPEGFQQTQTKRDVLLQKIAALEASEKPAQDAYQTALRSWRETGTRRRDAEAAVASAARELQDATSALPVKPEKYLPPAEFRSKLEKINARLAEIATERAALLLQRDAKQEGPCPPGTCRAHQLEVVLGKIDALDKDADLHRNYQTRCQAAIRMAEGYDNDVALVQARIARAQAALADANSRLAQTPPAAATCPAPPASTQGELEGLRLQLEQVDGDLATLTDNQKARETWDREYEEYGNAVVREEALLQESSRWDALVKALEPKGLAARLSEDAVQQWADQVDAKAWAYFGMRFRIVFGQKEWALEGMRNAVDATDPEWTPISQMSDGERLLLSACIQVAIVRCTPFPVVFLDGAQAADISRMKRLVKFLHASDVQAFLFATSQNQAPGGAFVKPKHIPIPGVTAWWVENGQITQMQAEEAVTA